MPLAAIVGDKVFCVHGGLPFPSTWLTTDIERAINALPADLPHPALMTLAWDLLWNDVLTCASDGVDEYGFTYSTERNSSRLFNAHALSQFCSAHNFTHIIRAHQTKLYGSQVLFDGRLITLGVTPTHISCALVEHDRIQIMRIHYR